MDSTQVLALVNGQVDHELLLRNEYLAAENEILKLKLTSKIRLDHFERIRLAALGQRIGKKALQELACIVKPETILKWYRKLVAQKFDTSRQRKKTGRPKTQVSLEDLVVRLATENPGWGYDRIAGITPYPDEAWIKQSARNITMADIGFLDQQKYLIHDRDAKFCVSFREILKSAGIKPIRLPPFSPNLNAYAERFVRSVKEECLSKLILFGENSLRRALNQYLVHYHHERNHQGLQNEILFPDDTLRPDLKDNPIVHTKRLNFLSYYFHSKSCTDENSGHFRLYPTELLTNYG